MFGDWPKGQGRQEGQATDQQDGHQQQRDEQRAMGREAVLAHRRAMTGGHLLLPVLQQSVEGRRGGTLEALLLDEQGYLTEGCYTSLFVERADKLLTPPLSRGVLPGSFNAKPSISPFG